MHLAKIIPILLVVPMIFTSCFWSKDEPKTSAPTGTEKVTEAQAPVEPLISEQKPDAIKKAATERKRVEKLNTLTPSNLETQMVTQSGKTVLGDRTLFMNYIKSEKVDTSARLMVALEKVTSFAQKNGVELNETDFRSLIASSQSNNPSWNVCGNFNATKKDLDSKSKYYEYILKYCNPPLPPLMR
jgi:hypothetical protein